MRCKGGAILYSCHMQCAAGKIAVPHFYCHKIKIGWFAEVSSCAAGKVATPYTITILQQGSNAALTTHHVLQGFTILYAIATI